MLNKTMGMPVTCLTCNDKAYTVEKYFESEIRGIMRKDCERLIGVILKVKKVFLKVKCVSRCYVWKLSG